MRTIRQLVPAPLVVLLSGMLLLTSCASGGSSHRSDAGTSPTAHGSGSDETGCGTDRMSPEARVAKLVFAEIEHTDLDPVRDLVDRGVGGLFFRGDGLELLGTPELQAIIADAVHTPFVAIDAEGAGTPDLARLGTDTEVPSARDMHATMDAEAIRALATRVGAELAELGVTVNFAPVADLDGGDGVNSIGNRAFSPDPDAVTTDAIAFARGMLANDVIPTFKHFPGSGRASADPHDGSATTPGIDDLRATDLVPFAAAVHEVPDAAVMLSHVIVPGLTDGEPASTSPEVVDLLRDELGFDGLIVTDDLSMGAPVEHHGLASDAAVAAVRAGVDMVLVLDSDAPTVFAKLTDLDDTATSDSVERVLRRQPGSACA